MNLEQLENNLETLKKDAEKIKKLTGNLPTNNGILMSSIKDIEDAIERKRNVE